MSMSVLSLPSSEAFSEWIISFVTASPTLNLIVFLPARLIVLIDGLSFQHYCSSFDSGNLNFVIMFCKLSKLFLWIYSKKIWYSFVCNFFRATIRFSIISTMRWDDLDIPRELRRDLHLEEACSEAIPLTFVFSYSIQDCREVDGWNLWLPLMATLFKDDIPSTHSRWCPNCSVCWPRCQVVTF